MQIYRLMKSISILFSKWPALKLMFYPCCQKLLIFSLHLKAWVKCNLPTFCLNKATNDNHVWSHDQRLKCLECATDSPVCDWSKNSCWCKSHQFPFNYLATSPMNQFKKAQLAKKASVICCCANIYPSYENLQILTDRNPNVLRNTKL